MLPKGAPQVLARDGWAGLMEFILGEAQFGPRRYGLSAAKRAYYRLRPFVPRPVVAHLRRTISTRPPRGFPLEWPLEDRYVRFMYELLDRVARGTSSRHPRTRFWPGEAEYAFVLTHDVERAAGQAFVRTLADIDEQYGFRACFNFVMEDYPVDRRLIHELVSRGFEVGIHGLRHDGSLFASHTAFVRGAASVAEYARALGVVGFRSPATHRNPAWMQQLQVEYDSSFFDTDPFEVMPGGTMSIWPFMCGHVVELPYTLAQDHTLVSVLGQRTPRLWVDKVDFISEWGGMALLNVHPDYVQDALHRGVYEEFLQHMRLRVQRGTTQPTSTPQCWHALPRQVARWWRDRVHCAPA